VTAFAIAKQRMMVDGFQGYTFTGLATPPDN
jgi:hypothetical protein